MYGGSSTHHNTVKPPSLRDFFDRKNRGNLPIRRTDLTVSGSLKKGFFGGLEIHPTKKGQTMDKKNTARKSLRITLGTFAVIFILLTLMALFADIFPIIGDWFKFIALFFKTLFGALFS